VHNASDSQRSSNHNPSNTPPAPCYNYDPIRCRSTVDLALFAYVIVSHYSPIASSNRRLTICRLPEVAGRSEGRHNATRCKCGGCRTTHRESITGPDSRPAYRQSLVRPFARILFLVYERAIHPLLFLIFVQCVIFWSFLVAHGPLSPP